MYTLCWVDVEYPNFVFGPLVFLAKFLHFLRILYFKFSAILGISCQLIVEWMWNVLIFFWFVDFLYLHLGKFLHLFYHIFSYFWHFMSTPCWVDVERPNFLWLVDFLYLHFRRILYFKFSTILCISRLLFVDWMWNVLKNFWPVDFLSQILTLFENSLLLIFSYLGISCPLIVKWMWNVLIFFWSIDFLHLHLAKFLHFMRILYIIFFCYLSTFSISKIIYSNYRS